MGIVQDGNILEEVKLPTSAAAPKEQIIREIVAGIEQLGHTDTLGFGIGVPGLVDEQRGVVLGVQNIPSWQEVHLKRDLERHFQKPVYLTNDANSFVLGEKLYGKARDYRNVVGLTLGSGLGSGVIIDGKLHSGTLSSAGEIGGVPYLDQTLEDYCSGKFFSQQFGITGHEAQRLAEQGDAHALEAFSQYGYHLGSAIKVILYLLSPEAVFLGGSISSCYTLFEESMQTSIAAFPFKPVLARFLVAPSEIENAAILGAAALFEMKNVNNPQPHKAFS